eukprot:6490433-Prymnesium_polylepis.1
MCIRDRVRGCEGARVRGCEGLWEVGGARLQPGGLEGVGGATVARAKDGRVHAPAIQAAGRGRCV